MLSLLGRDTRQHIYDTILSFLDDERCADYPVTLGLRVNSLPKGRVGCIYLCVMERAKNQKLHILKRFRFAKCNWYYNQTATEHHLLTARRRACEMGTKVLHLLNEIICLVQSERNPVLTLTHKQTDYFTTRRFEAVKCRYWKCWLQADDGRIRERLRLGLPL